MKKVKSRKEIAGELGISPRTLHRWLEKARITLPGGLLSETHQQLIYEALTKSTKEAS